jgi:phytoene dehydrogenase-like protein
MGGALIATTILAAIMLLLFAKTFGWDFYYAASNAYWGIVYGYVEDAPISAWPYPGLFAAVPLSVALATTWAAGRQGWALVHPEFEEGGRPFSPPIRDSGDRVIATLDRYAPGLADLIEDRLVLGPPDLEERFGLTGGHIFHGELLPDWLFGRRPAAGWARYRTPLPGLYLCGSGAHPGGGVCGAPGANAARELLRDLTGRRPLTSWRRWAGRWTWRCSPTWCGGAQRC